MASYSLPRLSEEAYKSITERAKRARARKLAEARAVGRLLSEDDELFVPIEDKADTNCKLPSEEEMEQRKLEVQSRWDEKERMRRAGFYAPDEVDVAEAPDYAWSANASRRRGFGRSEY